MTVALAVEPRPVTVADAAAAIGRHPKTVYSWIYRRQLARLPGGLVDLDAVYACEHARRCANTRLRTGRALVQNQTGLFQHAPTTEAC